MVVEPGQELDAVDGLNTGVVTAESAAVGKEEREAGTEDDRVVIDDEGG